MWIKSTADFRSITPAMSTTLPHELLESLRELAAATNRADCIARIEAHLERLFPELGAVLELEPPALEDAQPGTDASGRRATAVLLEARGRRHGRVRFADGTELDPDARQGLEAFSQHAALALDNARLLEEHDRRARRDPLTGLLNRGEFHELLSTAVARCSGQPGELMSLAVFDLDHFKKVNDAGGHGAGDRLLRATAATLTAVSRTSDAAFRVGGDEFALLLPGCGAEDSAAIAERAADAIGQLESSAGASWGVATIPTDASTRDGLVAAADAGMYERKGRRSQSATLLRRDARSRLQVASSLATRLTELHEPRQIAQTVVDQLHSAFGCYLAAIHRLHDDGVLRIVAAAGRLTEEWDRVARPRAVDRLRCQRARRAHGGAVAGR